MEFEPDGVWRIVFLPGKKSEVRDKIAEHLSGRSFEIIGLDLEKVGIRSVRGNRNEAEIVAETLPDGVLRGSGSMKQGESKVGRVVRPGHVYHLYVAAYDARSSSSIPGLRLISPAFLRQNGEPPAQTGVVRSNLLPGYDLEVTSKESLNLWYALIGALTSSQSTTWPYLEQRG